MSHFPDPALFSAVQDFQRTNGLRVDGVMNPGGETEHALLSMLDLGQARAAVQNAALAIQGMGRNGDKILAHITPEEAHLLDAITDGGSVNPRTGLLEFWWGDGLDDNDAQGGYDAGAASDNQAAENDRQYSGGGNDHESGNDNNHGGNDDGSSGDTLGGNGLNKSQGAQPGGVEVSDDAARDAARSHAAAGQVQDNSLTSGFFDKKDEEEEDWSMLDNDAQASYDAAAANAAQAKENAKNAGAVPDNESNSQEKTVEETAAWIDAYTANQANMAALREEDRKARAAAAAAQAKLEEDEKLTSEEEKALKTVLKAVLSTIVKRAAPLYMLEEQKDSIYGYSDDPA